MRMVDYVDERGRERSRAIRDTDPDELAKTGIPSEPPEVDRIDWEKVKRRLHNELMRRGLLTVEDLGATDSQGNLQGAVIAALKNEVIKLYRSEERELQRGRNT